jgi:hypothetical protein
MVGVKTHTVTACKITGEETHDSVPFPALLKSTVASFDTKEV